MLKALSVLVLSTALAGGAWLVSSSPASPVALPASLGPGGILEMHRHLFAAMDRGEVEAVKSFIDDDRRNSERQDSLFLVEASGAPVRAWGGAGARELLARLVEADKKSGGEWKTTITKSSAECPSGDLSYAVLEFERAHIVDGKTVLERYRSTSLVRMSEGQWKLFHWHVSPAMPTESALVKR